MKTKEKYTGLNPYTGRPWDKESIERAESERLSFKVPVCSEKVPPTRGDGVG